MRTREQVIESMCQTWRHDYRLEKGRFCGMTDDERDGLRTQMAQIFDNEIAPFMEFRKELRKTELIRDGIIKIQSFELTEKEQRLIGLGLKYGPAAAYMRDDGTFLENPAPQPSEKNTLIGWVFRKFLKRQ